MRWICLWAIFVLSGCTAHSGATGVGAQNIPRIEEVAPDDADFPVIVPASFKSARGYLIVKEDRASADDRSIKLPVIIVKARDSKEASERPPVLRLAGGPGISGLSAAKFPGAYPWTQNRDFIILGQRGTQDSEPALVCPEYHSAIAGEESGSSERVKAAQVCQARYRSEGVLLSAYNTAQSAADIEDLRKVLGEKALSLYAGSYGTRLALTFARDFPDRVASMVLDSPLPHTVSYDDESPRNFGDALEAVASTCAAQPSCAQVYPRLFDRFTLALSEAAEQPWSVEMPDGESVELADRDLAVLIFLGSSFGVATAPRIMDAIARRDAQVVSTLLNTDSSPAQFAWGMRLSVWCSEALPFSERSKNPATETFAGLDGAVFPPEVCAAWNVKTRPAEEKAPTVSSAPTLIIAGEYDPNTPPRWGVEAAQTLQNSYVAVIPFGRHMETTNWSGDGCAMKIAENFFNDEKTFLEAPDEATECLRERQPPSFDLGDLVD